MFSKRETLTQNIAYMGIMAAINVVFVLLTYFVPFLIFLLVFILPLTSVIVTLYCQKKYIPIYLIATIALCMIATINNFTDTLFYVIPALISGVCFGLMVEKKVPSIWIIFVTSLITTGLSYAFVPLIQLIYQQNIIDIFTKILKIDDAKYLAYYIPCFFYLISLIQSVLCYMFIKAQLPKMGKTINDNNNNIFTYFAGILLLFLHILFIFVYPQLSYLFTMWLIYFSCFIFVDLLLKIKVYIYIVLGICLIAQIVLFAVFYPSVANPYGFHLISISPVLVICLGIVDNYLFENNTKIK